MTDIDLTTAASDLVAGNVAKFMPGWLPQAGGRIVRTVDGASVIVLAGDRIEFVAGWPAYSDGNRFHPDRYLKIGVSVSRSPEAMAGEIERRLLPDYLPAYAKALAFIKDREAEQASTRACAERLAAIVGATVQEYRGGFGLYESDVTAVHDGAAVRRIPDCITKVHVRSGGRVTIELSDLDEFTTRTILVLLKKREEAAEKLINSGDVRATGSGREED